MPDDDSPSFAVVLACVVVILAFVKAAEIVFWLWNNNPMTLAILVGIFLLAGIGRSFLWFFET